MGLMSHVDMHSKHMYMNYTVWTIKAEDEQKAFQLWKEAVVEKSVGLLIQRKTS